MGVEDSQVKPETPAPPAKGMADTPTLLANAVVKAVDLKEASSWLDPCAGSGQLIQAVLRAGVQPDTVLAVDLQTEIPSLDHLGVESLTGTDFVRWSQQTQRRFDRVVANPPFVRLSELQQALLCPAADTQIDGAPISGTSNYWVAFLVSGMRLLRPGGSLAYILPAAWEYADYADPVRSLCASSFRELDVHRVSRPMFDSVDDGSVLLVGRGYREQHRPNVRMFRHHTLSDLSKAISLGETSSRAVSSPDGPGTSLQGDEVPIGEFAQIRIGAVTGDANYFLISESRRLELSLPLTAVRPVLSRSEHIVSSEIDNETWEELLADGKRVWLFYPSDNDLQNPDVQEYLELDPASGGCQRTAGKVRDRNPWYHVPIPPAFDGFVSGMTQTAPWVALNRMSGLTISNTLYGIRFLNSSNIDEQASWCLSMLSSITSRSRAQLAREYPQGLLKLEPGDFAKIMVRRPKTTEDARTLYRQAVNLIKSGCHDQAQAMVDDWLD